MRILVATQPVDFRKGIDGLAAICRQQLQEDPMTGCAFIFRNRQGTAIKVLLYDGQGFLARPPRLLLVWSTTVLVLLREKNLSIRRLRRMLFGSRTERTDDMVAAQDTNESAADKQSQEKPSKPRTSSGNSDKQPRRRSKGHGRTPVDPSPIRRPEIQDFAALPKRHGIPNSGEFGYGLLALAFSRQKILHGVTLHGEFVRFTGRIVSAVLSRPAVFR